MINTELATMLLDDTTSDAAHVFRIDSDALADWAVKKVKEEKDEYKRLYMLAEEQIADIEARLEQAEKRCESKTAFLTGKLHEYFEGVPHKETKTTAQYQLLSGKLVWQKPKVNIEKDDQTLLEYLRGAGLTEYIKTEEKPKWADLKKALVIEGSDVINTETGEIVDCLRAVETPGTFEVK